MSKINSKRIKDLDTTPKTTKLLEEDIGEKIYDIELCKDLLDMTSKAQATRNKSKTRQTGLRQTHTLIVHQQT